MSSLIITLYKILGRIQLFKYEVRHHHKMGGNECSRFSLLLASFFLANRELLLNNLRRVFFLGFDFT